MRRSRVSLNIELEIQVVRIAKFLGVRQRLSLLRIGCQSSTKWCATL